MYGWAGKRLKVYLSEGKIVKEPLSDEFRLNYLGGRGFNSKTLFDEIKPGIDPLGPDNVFAVGVGPLNGTAAPGSARWTVSARSTVTAGLGDGNGGGDFSSELKFAGYDQIVFYGRSPKPVYLWISDDHVELRDASNIWGKTTRDTHYLLVQELKDREIRELCIGPAGENLVRLAKVFANVTRAGGKGGMGAVMGSKNLKAVVVRGTGSVKIARPAEFLKVLKRDYEKLMSSSWQKVFREQGSMSTLRGAAMRYSLSTRNAQSGYFEGWENLTSEAFEHQFAVKHRGCAACPISCSHYFRVKDGPYATHGESNEYGTTYPFGSKCGIDNLAAVLKIHTICDQLGLDTHSTGGTVCFAMHCWQEGLLTAKDTDGLELKWGNADAVIQLLPKIAYRQGFGALLAEGSFRASKHIKGSEACLRTLKGLEISALYLGPGEEISHGLAYATATRGPDHLRGGVGMYSWGMSRLRDIVGGEEGEQRLVREPRSTEFKAIVVALDQDYSSFFNSLELCTRVVTRLRGALEPDEQAELASAVTGIEMNGDDLMKIGERITNVERAFNIREGMGRKDDILPKVFLTEQQGPWGPTGISEEKFQAMLDEYYQFKGWSKEGIPSKQKLNELGLGYIAEQIGAV